MINLTKLVKEGFERGDQTDNIRGALREDDIVLTQVKLKVTHIAWTNSPQPGTPSHPRTEGKVTREGQIITLTSQSPFLVVNITKSNTASSEAFGQVQATKEDQNFIRVILQKGIIRGINRSMKLPLDKDNQELLQALGSYVEIDPSKPVSEPVQNKMKIGVAVEGPLGPRGATAELTSKEKKYKGHFVGTVIMYGKCLAGLQEGQVAELIQDLKKPPAGHGDLAALTMTSYKKKHHTTKAVAFTIEGDLECKWDFEQTVEWK